MSANDGWGESYEDKIDRLEKAVEQLKLDLDVAKADSDVSRAALKVARSALNYHAALGYVPAKMIDETRRVIDTALSTGAAA